MGTITGSQIIARAQTMLLDETGDQWTDAELLVTLAAAIVAVTTAKPNAYMLTERLRLVKGTLQDLPPDFKALKQVTRNLGMNGVTPGRPIRLIQMNEMDRTGEDWHNAPQSGEVEVYMYDVDNPKQFWVYPPMKMPPSCVEIMGPAVPPAYTDADTPIPVDDELQDPLFYYVMAHSYGKNSKRGDTAKFQNYLQLCFTALGADEQAQRVLAAAPPQES